nr:hypothetical protein [Lachnospiraceae bacterium]
MKRKMRIAVAVISSLAIGLMPAQGLMAAGVDTADQATPGGWTFSDQGSVALPEGVATGFSEATYGMDLSPVALVAQQVVKGTNDMLLCRNEDGYRMIVINRDLQNNAMLVNDVPFNLPDYVGGGEGAPVEQPLDGGWYDPEEKAVIPLPDDAQAAFDEAFEGFAGSKVEPMALLGTQVVSGIRYAILCDVTPMTLDPVSSVQVVTIYSDATGDSSIEGFCAIDPKDFSSKGEPVYRMYNPNSGEHFYTVSADERDDLAAAGWIYEYNCGFMAPLKGTDDALPVYRFYNPNGNDHHFTMDEDEAAAIKAAGWSDEGVAFYGYVKNLNKGKPVYRLYNPNNGQHFFTEDLLEA